MSSSNPNSRKPTVAHVMPWSGIGGVEIATLRLADATRDQFRHVAFCLPDALDLKSSFEQLGIETVVYTPPEPSLRHFGRFYKESSRVARQLKDARVDIVHFSDEKAAYHNSFAALLVHTHTVCHLRVSYPHLDLRNRLCLRPIQSFIFVSKEAMDTFAMPLPEGKAKVVYDAIEIPDIDVAESAASVRKEFNIPPDCTIIGTLARVSPQKDYFTLAAAATEVLAKHPNTRFLIVGDNSNVPLNKQHYQEVKQELDRRGITDKFIFTGHRTDVPRFIAAMDICVLCTHREGLPLSILEVMAMQKPVIATAVGGIPEIVIPGVTGFLHQHEDSQELASAITKLIEDPQLALHLASSACENVRQNYSREKFAREITEIYLGLMRK